MDGTVLVALIEPLVGKQGQVRLLFRGLSGRWTINDDKHPLIGVRLRPDGLAGPRITTRRTPAMVPLQLWSLTWLKLSSTSRFLEKAPPAFAPYMASPHPGKIYSGARIRRGPGFLLTCEQVP